MSTTELKLLYTEHDCAVATRFIALVIGWPRAWQSTIDISNQEQRVLVELLMAANFEFGTIAPGRICGQYSDSSRTYPINTLCPYHVVRDNGEAHNAATGWLEIMFSSVFNCKEMERASLIASIAKDIERSRPLDPITLNEDNDQLDEYPSRNLFEHSRDTNKASSCVGIHRLCGGWMDRRRSSTTHDSISCRCCHLRISFSKEVKTYGDLREALSLRHAVALASKDSAKE